jgi:hypothetical protein
MTKAFCRKVFLTKEDNLNSFYLIMTVFSSNKFWQIPVPAAAVKQEEQVVFVIIGRKGCVDCFFFIL